MSPVVNIWHDSLETFITPVEVIARDGECLLREAQDDLHFGFALLDCFARILLNRLEVRSERHKQCLLTEHSL